MIVVTRLNRTRLALNPDLVARVHASPDTTLVLADGSAVVVRESMDEVIDRIVAFRARVISTALSEASPDDLHAALVESVR